VKKDNYEKNIKCERNRKKNSALIKILYFSTQIFFQTIDDKYLFNVNEFYNNYKKVECK